MEEKAADPTATEEAKQPDAGTTDGSKNTDTPGPVPYDRFKTVNDQLAELRTWKEQREQEEQEAKAKQLEEAGQHKQLYDTEKTAREKAEAELKSLKPTLERQQAVLQALYQSRLKELSPEGKRAVESLPESVDLLGRLDWLNANAQLFARATPPNINAADKGGDGTNQDPKEREEEIRQRFNMRRRSQPALTGR